MLNDLMVSTIVKKIRQSGRCLDPLNGGHIGGVFGEQRGL